MDKPKNKYTEEELLVISTMKINSLEREITVYTDGSTDGHQEKGGAGVYIHDATHSTILEESYPAGRYCSSYGGECVAMLKALEWLQRNPTPSLICTDSDSLVSALEENNWKDRDPWLKQIKKIIFDYPQEITLLWIPSHCGIEGNDKADELAKKGTEKNQEDIPVTHAIMKAKIKAQSWPLTHTRAEQTYQDLRKPNYKIEKEWPKRVRSLFSRLRTGHAVELKAYRHRIEKEEDGICELCEEEDETIEHVLCRCSAESRKRHTTFEGGVAEMNYMVTKAEKCRKFLEDRFEGLRIDDEEEQEDDNDDDDDDEIGDQ